MAVIAARQTWEPDGMMSLEPLTAEDLDEMLGEVARFAAAEIAPLIEHPEHPIEADQLAGVTAQAARLGLVDSDPDGVRLWGSRPGLVRFSVDALRMVARLDAGVAFHLHRIGLLARLRDHLGLGTAASGALSLQGHWGFGRQALARLLAGVELTASDRALLVDYFDLSHERIVFGDPHESLLTVGFDGTAITWHAPSAGDCGIVAQPHAHGLDALAANKVGLPGGNPAVHASTDLYGQALFLDSLGLMAIAAGLVDHALARATDYAGTRVQGGALIKSHPAVQQMLAQLATTAQHASMTLAALSRKEPSAAAFADLAAARAPYHPLCCRAVNQAMQVFGGIGYMQDVGVERLVRDANCLRVQDGTPVELELFVAAWRDT